MNYLFNLVVRGRELAFHVQLFSAYLHLFASLLYAPGIQLSNHFEKVLPL